MMKFYLRKRPLTKSERMYEEEELSFSQKYSKFPVFVAVGAVLVLVVVAIILYMNFQSGILRTFVKSSSKNFESGGFSYHITAGLNENTFMEYDGEFELKLDNQQMTSLYHAKYDEYEYDSVTYSRGTKAYRGNYYGGKWSVEDYTDRSLDFFDFYRDYRKGKLDTSAIVRFTNSNDKFSAPALGRSIAGILDELSKTKSINNILRQDTKTSPDGMIVTYNPDMRELMDIIVRNVGSAYTSANAFADFKATVENSYENLEKVNCVVRLNIDENGYLTEVNFSYELDGENYFMNFEFFDFGDRDIEIPESFLAAADLQE